MCARSGQGQIARNLVMCKCVHDKCVQEVCACIHAKLSKYRESALTGSACNVCVCVCLYMLLKARNIYMF